MSNMASRVLVTLMLLRSGAAYQPAPLRNDLMIRAARGEHGERTPIWLFRQARGD